MRNPDRDKDKSQQFCKPVLVACCYSICSKHTEMSPLYSGSADEWSYINGASTVLTLSVDFIIDNFEDHMKKAGKFNSHQFTVNDTAS